MKIICTDDWHLRSTPPANRIENDYFADACQPKADFIFDYALNHEIEHILHGGDLFDQPVVSDKIKTWLARRLKNIKMFAVSGQHDRIMRALTDSCSLSVMFEAGCITKLDFNSTLLNSDYIYGCSYNDPIPKILDINKFNILVIHKMISDKDYWQGHVEYTSARKFLIDHKFDLIVSGDNHATFICAVKNRTLLNSGSLMRSRIDQKDHKPCFFVFDTITREVEQILIPVKPAEEVFNLVETEVKSNEDLDKFIREFESSGWVNSIDIKAKAMKLIDNVDIDDNTKMIILEVIKEVDEKGEK